MASPLLTASNAAASPATSPAVSNATAATFGPGSRSNTTNNNVTTTPQRQDPQARRGSGFNAQPNRGAAGQAAGTNAAADASSATSAVHVIDGPGGRILCVADVRGNLSSLNKLAAEANAQAIIHTGDFGFYDAESFERISDRTLRHLVQYCTIIPAALRTKLLTADAPGGGRSAQGPTGASTALPPPSTPCKEMRAQMLAHPDSPLLTDFPKLLSGQLRFDVPVYTVWGACEDVRILEKLRTREFVIDNLHVLDEASTVAIEVGGVRLRLFGLGGAVVLHKLFDNGDGAATIAGGQGTMWTTILQIGELIDTAQRCYDPTETRLLVTHASPGREGLLMQLALALKADLTISAGLHFRYGVSYNEFSVQSDTEQFRRKLLQSKSAFGEVWDSVRQQVEDVVDDQQRILLNNGLAVTNRAPNAATATGAVHEEPAWKNTWNWNLPDAAFGHLVLDIREGRVSSEMKSQGFNFAYRRTEAAANVSPSAPVAPVTTNSTTPGNAIPTAPGASPRDPLTGIPSGPAKMRQQQEFGHSQQRSGSFPPKSPRQHRSPNPSFGAGEGKSEHGSRPNSSRGPRHERGHRSSGDEAAPRGPRNGGHSATSSDAKAKEHRATPSGAAAAVNTSAPATATDGTTNGTSGKADGVPATTPPAGAPTKATGKGHRSKKSGASSRSEKSGSEAETKPATPATPAAAAASTGTAAAGAATGGKEITAAAEGSPAGTPARGGRGGGGRGGRGGSRGGRGRGGGSQSQERRKSGAGESKPAAPAQSGNGSAAS